MPTIDRTKFVNRSQILGAAILYAPEKVTDPLTNLGVQGLVLPGVLTGGPGLVVPGMINGSAKVSLDGVNDFIATNWLNRVNMLFQPSPEVANTQWSGAGGFFNNPATLTRDIATTQFDGVACWKVACTGANNTEGISTGGGLAGLTIGKTYTASCMVKGAVGGEEVRIGIGSAEGGFGQSGVTVLSAVEWKRISVTFTATATKAAALAITGPAGKKVQTFFMDCALVEETNELRSFFPLVAEVKSGVAAFTGTEWESVSGTGSFPVGSKRTFVGFANRVDVVKDHPLMGGSGTSPPFLWLAATNQNVVWQAQNGAGGAVTWAAAWPGIEQNVFWAVAFDDVANTASLYINGVLVSTQAHANTYAGAGSLQIGAMAASFFKGSELPFAAFPSLLGAQEIQELFEYVADSSVAVKREMIPDRLGIRIDAANGSSARWAEDELTPYNVLSDVEFSDEMPGGYKELTGVLARDPQINYQDLGAYGDLKAYTPGGEIVWQGSLDKGPGVSGDQFNISPSALGYQYIMEDDNAASIGFIDCDVSKWSEPSTDRKIQMLGAGFTWSGVEMSQGFNDIGKTGPAIIFQVVSSVAGVSEIGEAWYYGDTIEVGEVQYDYIVLKAGGDMPNQSTRVHISTDDKGGTVDSGAVHSAVAAVRATVAALLTGRRYVLIQCAYVGAALGNFTGDSYGVSNPKVLGRHKLGLQGVWPNVGFTPKQMLEYVIANYASPLTFDPAFIEDDGYIVTQAWYPNMPLPDIVNDITKYSLYDWFVYTDKRFELRKPQTYNRFWRALTAPSDLEELGLDSQRLWRRIVVQFSDATGVTQTVGPPGSNANTISAELEITDPDHPAVKAGRTRRDILDLGGISTPAAAIQVGKRFLEEANLTNRSGSATLRGYVMDTFGVLRPASQVKSGDWIAFTDAADTSYRKIVSKRYIHKDRSAEVELDAPASGMDELLERLQADLITTGVTA